MFSPRKGASLCCNSSFLFFFSSRHQRFHSIFVILQVYNIAVLFQTSAEGPLQVTSKVAARGGVPRKRMATYAMDDFIRMSAVPLTSPRARLGQVTDIISLRSRHFNLFEISSTRAESFSFTRKRFLTSDGNSTPFHYYRNDELNRKDCIKRKRARRRQIADPWYLCFSRQWFDDQCHFLASFLIFFLLSEWFFLKK